MAFGFMGHPFFANGKWEWDMEFGLGLMAWARAYIGRQKNLWGFVFVFIGAEEGRGACA